MDDPAAGNMHSAGHGTTAPGAEEGAVSGEVPLRTYNRLALFFGILTAIIGTASLADGRSPSVPFGSLFGSFFSLAVSTALVWVFFGAVLAVHAVHSVPRAGRLLIMAGIGIVAVVEAFEIPLNIIGMQLAARAGFAPPGTAAVPAVPYLPAAPFLIIIAGVALLLLVKAEQPSPRRQQDLDIAGTAGGVITVVSLLFILGFLYEMPILAGTSVIPVGIASAFAGFFTGAGLICAAGPDAVPLRYFTGESVRSRILRAIIPLVFVIFFLDNVLDLMVAPWLNIQGPALFSLTAVVFSLAASLALVHVAGGLSARLEAEENRRKRVEGALREAGRKLNLLNSITRHDILNQLIVIEGYIGMLREDYSADPRLAGELGKMDESAKTIEHLISFTKFYQELGVREPAWHRLETVTGNVMRMAGFEKIRFETSTGDLQVYADPLFEKVFYNLFENAVRHGGHVTVIRIGFRREGEEGVLAVEDNGVGVPEKEKDKIFLRGHGRHTGFGLFLSREILEITGITIRENGIPGQGARFEMRIPVGMHRGG